MDAVRDRQPAVARAEAARDFWLTLAAALLPPLRPQVCEGLRDVLARDLSRHARGAGYEVEGGLRDLHDACAGLAGKDAALELGLGYSRLFLPPAGVATLNLSRYVDSGVGGACMDALESAYAVHGLAANGALRDLPDHAAMQLECLAWLENGGDRDAAAEFAGLCLAGALPRLHAQLRSVAPRSPFTALVAVAAAAVAQLTAGSQEPARAPRPNRRHDLGRGVWQHCEGCGRPYARVKELEIMRLALARAGLPADHLARCPDCRDRDRGFFRREIA
jgi:TorA maturation chaperone TorD